MTSDPTTTLAAHRWLATSGACACGDPTVSVPEWPAHLLAVLAEEGWATVKLPEPDMSDEKFGQVWSNDPVVGTVQACLDGTCELRGDYEYTHTSDELRTAGAVLLAAATAAEEAKPDA